MSAPAEYLAFLRQKGVKLWIEDGQLRYRAHKGALSNEDLARLRVMKDGIVAELSEPPGGVSADTARTVPTTADPVPLSFQQQWLLKLMEEHPSWKPTLSFTLRLTGELDIEALQRSLDGVLHKHPILRAGIVWLSQEVGGSQTFRLAITRVPGDSAGERERNARTLIDQIEGGRLDRAIAPMDAQLLEVSQQEHFLVLLIHRLVADCLGVSQLLADLWVMYKEALQGLPAAFVGDKSWGYSEYAVRQRQTDEAWQRKHTAYWHEHLARAEPIRWPVDECTASRTPDTQGLLVSLQCSFGEAVSARLRELARQTRTLPSLVVLTLYVASIATVCRQMDFVVPFLTAGRASEHGRTVGYFSHAVYLRITLSGGESFVEMLKVVSNEYFRGAAFRQDSGRMALQRPDLLQGTLCQWLSWHPAELAGLDADELSRQSGVHVMRMRPAGLQELTNVPPAAVDIEISFFDTAGDISALAIYRPERFSETAVARLMRQQRSIAEQVIHDPHAAIVG
jgi:hypothetical protein